MIAAIDEFREAIAVALGPGALRDPAPDEYAVDSITPETIIVPADEREAAVAIAEAAASRVSLIPIGGGTHLGAGNLPKAYDAALSLMRLDRVVAYEPADMTVTLQAGVRLADAQQLLASHGQMLPLDPPCDADATVGGVLAANASGPMRHAHGTARDWLIGIRVVLADGTVTKSGGRVVKNVTGYDMAKLHIGALGTLGVITEATFKVAPLPRAEATAVIELPSAPAACQIADAAGERGIAAIAAEVLSPPASHAVLAANRWTAVFRLAGSEAAVERSLNDLNTLASQQGAKLEIRERSDVWPRWGNAFSPSGLSLRISVLPSHVAQTIEVLDRRFAGAAPVLSSTQSAGLIRANLQPGRIRASTLLEHAREACGRRGGSVIVDAAPPALKRQVDVFGPLRPDFAIMRRLKEEFDPQGTLSPGRFMGRL